MSQLYQISEKIIENKKITNTFFETNVSQETLNRLSIYFITKKSDVGFFYTRLHNNNIPNINIYNLTKEDYINFYVYIKKIKSSINKIIQLYKFNIHYQWLLYIKIDVIAYFLLVTDIPLFLKD